MTTDPSLLCSNALSPKLVTLSGIVTSTGFGYISEKARAPIVNKPVPRLKEFICVPKKAFAPIDVTLFGIVKVVIAVALNA